MSDSAISIAELQRQHDKKAKQNSKNNALEDKKSLINEIRQSIMDSFDISKLLFSTDIDFLNEIRTYIKNYLVSHERLLSESDIENWVEYMIVDITGLGPIEKYRLDNTVREIKVNNYREVFLYKTTGDKVLVRDVFDSEEDFLHVVEKIARYNNKAFTFSTPRLMGTLPGKMRVHALHNSISLGGTTMNIRKFPKRFTLPELIQNGLCSEEIGFFLTLIPTTRKTFAACGPTGSGKTTLGMALFDYAPQNLSIVSIEDTPELVLKQTDWRPLVTREANSEGKGEVTIADLLSDCMRMTPDVIIVGEVRKPKDAYEMIQAFFTGHAGSFITTHASSTTNFLTRIANLMNDSGRDCSQSTAKAMICEAFDYIIYQESDEVNKTTKKRKQLIKGIAELRGVDEKTGEPIIREIFSWTNFGYDAEGNKLGKLEATGEMPEKLFAACADKGINFDEKMFREVFMSSKA